MNKYQIVSEQDLNDKKIDVSLKLGNDCVYVMVNGECVCFLNGKGELGRVHMPKPQNCLTLDKNNVHLVGYCSY